MVAEGGHLVVVDAKLVGHVDAEPLGAHLQGWQNTGSPPSSFAAWSAHFGSATELLSRKAWSLSVAGLSMALKAARRNKVERDPSCPWVFAPMPFPILCGSV